MHPLLWPSPPIASFGLMMSLALLAAWLVSRLTARDAGIDPARIDLMAPVVIGVGLASAWASTRLMPDASRVLYWALLPSVVAGILFCRALKLPLGRIGDSIAGGMALAIAIGRLGCYLGGCCFGHVCAAPPGVHFPRGSFAWREQVIEGLITRDAAASLPVHPTQIYESIAVALLAVSIGVTWRFRRTWGEAFLLFAAGYALIRFNIEFWRADESPTVASLRMSQWISLAVIAVVAAAFLIRRGYAVRWNLRVASPA